MAIKDSYIELYKSCSQIIKNNSSQLQNSHRDAAFDNFQELGFSNFEKSYEIDYGYNAYRMAMHASPYQLFSCAIPSITPYTYIVLNDMFCENPAQQSLPQGVIICGLNEATQKYPELVSQYFAKNMNTQTNGDQAFNAVFAQDGLFVYIPDNTVIEHPIQFVNLMNAHADTMAVSHNLIIVGNNSKVQMLICDHAYGGYNYLANRVTEVVVGENSTYEHYKLESSSEKMTNICSLLLSQKSNSEVVGTIITLKNGSTSNSVVADINGEYANTSINILGLGKNDQQVFTNTQVNHNSANSNSQELVKYILDNKSLGKFNGLIYVAKDSQKTAAYLTNKNMCLTSEAKMLTSPQLEIYADDVKCNHGSTVGQLDDNALFYLRSRGISQTEAKMMLMFAFVADVLDNVRIPALKDKLHLLIEKRLRNSHDHNCTNCDACK